MVSVDNFFVFGGGRWRGIDTGSGCVEGWGRAKFVVSRGGRLHAVRSTPVLAALRALAEARPSAARAGLPLDYNRYPRAVIKELGGCEHCKCHQQTRNSNKSTENKASIAVQCDNDAIQQNLPTQTKPPDLQVSSKRKRDSTTSEDVPSGHKVTTLATVHISNKPETKRRKKSIESPKIINKRKESTSTESKREQIGEESLKRKRQSSSSSERSLVLKSHKSPVRSLKLRKPGPLNRKLAAKESPILKSSKISDDIQQQNKISKYLQPKSKKMRKKKSLDEDLQLVTQQNVSLVISSDESDFDFDKRELMIRRQPKSSLNLSHNVVNKQIVESSSEEEPRRKIGPKRDMERSTRSKNKKKVVAESTADQIFQRNMGKNVKTREECLEVIERSSIEEITQNEGPKRVLRPIKNDQNQKPIENHSQNGSQNRNYPETSRELLIDERDVEILRLFLQKYYPDEELLRFDTDDEYKRMHFYQINPLVNIERCPRIARMIRGGTHDTQITLVDFASKLGLRSVSETSSQVKRYKTRRRVEKSYNNETDSSTDKENSNKLAQFKNDVKKFLKESENKNLKGRKGETTKQKLVEILQLSSDESDQETNKNLEVKQPIVKKPVFKKTLSTKRPGLKEYSNLEDHAIVSWVSVGARASCVNGNRIWRDLQGQFQRITGRGRTWHSLRNRYLRYILPRLAALALPPAQQSRLRAAAAAGEIKARRAEPRRNSMFKMPPRGAFSRRPQAPESPERNQTRSGQNTGKSPPSPRASAPRYSDVIRQFARTHRTHSSDGSGSKDSHERRSSRRRKSSPDKEREKEPETTKRKPLTSSPRKSPNVSTGSKQKLPSEHSDRKSRNNSSIVTNSRKSRRRSSSRSQSIEASETENSASDESRNKQTNRHSRRNVNTKNNSSIVSNGRKARGRSSSRECKSQYIETSETENSASDESRNKQTNRHSSRNVKDRSSDTSSAPKSERLKSNRHKSPIENNRRRSNRHKSPSGSNESLSESIRRKSNRHKPPSESNEPTSKSNRDKISLDESKIHKLYSESNRRKSNRHKSPESKRQSSLDTKKTDNSHHHTQILSSSTSLVKSRTRKLYNPKAFL